MFLSKDEKAIILLWRIECIRLDGLMGKYRSYAIAENKVRKLKKKLDKMGYETNVTISFKGGTS